MASKRVLGACMPLLLLLLLLPANARAEWKETVLSYFPGRPGVWLRGAHPLGGLLAGRDGALYGTTNDGGPGEKGTIFELAPPVDGRRRWQLGIIQYGEDVGDYPVGDLISDASGNLYGVTEGQPNGAVYKLAPPRHGHSGWRGTIIHNFRSWELPPFTTTRPADGYTPLGGLVMGKAGELYGTTVVAEDGCGTVYRLSPPAHGRDLWNEVILHTFQKGGAEGCYPGASVFIDKLGDLYGTTNVDGRYGGGTVFKIEPDKTGPWKASVIWSFGNGPDGNRPNTDLAADADGNLFGTTQAGGLKDLGTVFELSPPAAPGASWTEKVILSFSGHHGNGFGPAAGVIFDAQGNLYGTTAHGGRAGANGTVFKLVPPNGNSTEWTPEVLASLSGVKGSYPVSKVTFDAAGHLVGTTELGGRYLGSGVVFELQDMTKADTHHK